MRRRAAIALLIALMAACAQPPAAPSPTGPATPAAQSSPSAEPSPTTFVVPAPSEAPVVRKSLPNASFSNPSPAAELQSFFELFYQARTIRLGALPDAAALRGLVEGEYADYTVPLFEQEISDARRGRLLEATFSGIAVSVVFWSPRGPGLNDGVAQVAVTRTRREVRALSAPTVETATYKFRAERWRDRSAMYGGVESTVADPDGAHWAVYDFANPVTDRWISEPPPITTEQVAADLNTFFVDFYANRSVTPGQAFDINPSLWRAVASYLAYTTPLLRQTEQEVASGALKEIRYSDVSVKVVSWDEKATSHGGLALAEVTRTAHVTRGSGAEPPQTATYQFRVHRHEGGLWLAADFFRADVGRWVTEIAGATLIVPESGHG